MLFFQEVLRNCGSEPDSDGYVYRASAKYQGVRVYGPGRNEECSISDSPNAIGWLTLFSGQQDVKGDEIAFWFERRLTPCLEEHWVLPKRIKRLPMVENIDSLINQMLGA